MTYFEKIVLIACVVMTFAIWTGECVAQDFKYRLNYLPVSHHHGNTDATNEDHNGIGVSVTIPNGLTAGIMQYDNSYGDRGMLYSISGQVKNCTVCPGAGAGYAPAYAKTDHSTYVGWLSVSYKWVKILTVPGEVTALLISVPLN